MLRLMVPVHQMTSRVASFETPRLSSSTPLCWNVVNVTIFGGTAKKHGLMIMAYSKIGDLATLPFETRVRIAVGSVPDEQAFESMKSGTSALPSGVKMMLNSAEFYGPNLLTANPEPPACFFETYLDYADKTFLSGKASTHDILKYSTCRGESVSRLGL
ncbi:hypothetical protein GY45DRAFT_1065422 [Cubamyces sp. BRFM 1775]|nr:hypothetical protein GY45DRAFT_1065422 [Cubamyces sp. BRFM 1775]